MESTRIEIHIKTATIESWRGYKVASGKCPWDKENVDNDKSVNPLGRYINYKHICPKTEPQNTWSKTDKIKGRKRKFNNNYQRI